MRDWVEQQAVGRRPGERVRVAFHQLLDESGLGLEYDPLLTGSANEVFFSGRANCLGFANLFVGIARELGVEARYYRVDEVESYRREGDLILISEHLTAGYDADGEVRVVEFTFGRPAEGQTLRPIGDLTAMALFYSNRGAEALRAGDAAEAVRWLEVAVRLDESEASAWTNLGVARRRLGDVAGAEAIYRRVIEQAPEHLPAYVNLAGVLRLRREIDAAGEILRLLDRSDNRNPFSYLTLGDASLEGGQLDEARRFYRRAVRLGRGKAEPRAAMGLLALTTGDPEAARRWLRRARKIDEGEARTRRLEQSLAEYSPPPEGAAAAGAPEPSTREVES